MFTVEQFVLNKGAAPVLARNYALVSRVGAGADLDTWTNHVGPIGVFGRGATYDITYDNLRGKEPSFFGKIFGNTGRPGENSFDTTGGWLGFGDKYWLAALIPDQGAGVHSGFKAAAPGDRFQADFTRAPIAVPPGKQLTDHHAFLRRREGSEHARSL